jgi:hypothetical protein
MLQATILTHNSNKVMLSHLHYVNPFVQHRIRIIQWQYQ